MDFWRVICVMCCVITHADEVYAEANVFGVQNWTLQILSLISGACFAISSCSLLDYTARLFLISAVGILFTWGAAALAGQPWWEEPLMKCVFQNGYLLILICGAIVSCPLKHQIRALADQSRAWSVPAFYFMIVVVCQATHLVGLELNFIDSLESQQQILCLSTKTALIGLISSLGLMFFQEEQQGILGWILIAFIYGNRVAFREARPGSEFHLVDVYVLGCIVAMVPLMGQERIGTHMASWWPVWGIFCGLMLPPGAHGRLDQHPSEDILLRTRHYLVETICVLAFLSIPSGAEEVTIPLPRILLPHLRWLNWWALSSFIFHKGVYYVATPYPFGLSIIFGSTIAVYGIHKYLQPRLTGKVPPPPAAFYNEWKRPSKHMG